MDYYLGDTVLFGFDYAPPGWVACDGSMLSPMAFQELFALIGTKYGGDGRLAFGVPNMQGLEPVPGMRFYMATEGIWPQAN